MIRVLFPLGRIMITPGALDACGEARALRCLALHVSGDWGCVDAEDAGTNSDAIEFGNRILSAYPIDETKPSEGWGDNTLWIITEADRNVTTLLLPDEY